MTRHPFVAGGALPPRSPVYIEREADEKAALQLERMAYLMITEPRQQGKTSLVHYLRRLSDFTFCYVNLAGLVKDNEASWFQSLGQEIVNELRGSSLHL